MRFEDFLRMTKTENLETIIKNFITQSGLKYSENCVYVNEKFYLFLNELGAAVVDYTGNLAKIVTDDGSLYSVEYEKTPNEYDRIDFSTTKEISEKNNLYIITNRTESVEYAPAVVKTRKEAIDWMRECTANNVALKFRKECVKKDAEIKEIIIWAERNISGFSISENRSFLPYDDTSWQEMNIYKVEQPEQIKWLESNYVENSNHMDFYLNPKKCKPGDVAYVSLNGKIKILMIREIVSQSEKKRYEKLMKMNKSCFRDLLSTGELFYNADYSADFLSKDGYVFVWFKDTSLEYKGDISKTFK